MLTKQQVIDQLFNSAKQRTNTRIVQLMNVGERPELHQSMVYYTDFLPATASASQRVWHMLNNVNAIQLCLCGQSVPYKHISVGYRQYCSSKCAGADPKRAERYIATSRARYGVDNPSLAPEVAAKRRKTNIELYGVEFPLQNPKILAKTHDTQVETTGNWGFKLDSRKQLADVVKMETYGTTHSNPAGFAHVTDAQRALLADAQQLRKWHVDDKLSVTEIATNIGLSRSTVLRWFDNHGIDVQLHHQSSHERKIHGLLDDISVEYVTNDHKTIGPRELDVYIPSANVAIEVNGLWYHSDRYGYDKKRHTEKTQQCADRGIRLLHLFEHEINHNWDKCVDLITSAVGQSVNVGARKMTLTIPTNAEQRQFLDTNHIQGAGTIGKVAYCLVDDDGIVAMMTFGKPRYSKAAEWELLRYAVRGGINVQGGASRLFKAFTNDHNPASVISYCDRRLFTGKVYEMLGFSHSHNSVASYWYFNTQFDRLYHRSHFQKHTLANKLATFDPALTEWENMAANNWNRIWDCGNSVWMWNNQLT